MLSEACSTGWVIVLYILTNVAPVWGHVDKLPTTSLSGSLSTLLELKHCRWKFSDFHNTLHKRGAVRPFTGLEDVSFLSHLLVTHYQDQVHVLLLQFYHNMRNANVPFPLTAMHISRTNSWHVCMTLSSIVDVRQLELPSSERCHRCGCTGSWSACGTRMDSGAIASEVEKDECRLGPVLFQGSKPRRFEVCTSVSTFVACGFLHISDALRYLQKMAIVFGNIKVLSSHTRTDSCGHPCIIALAVAL
jgi:hypothetical protein